MNEELQHRIEKLLEDIKRENREHMARLTIREANQTGWIIGALIAFFGITLGLIAAIFRT